MLIRHVIINRGLRNPMHAKIILIGEHAAVYQKPAIVCPVFDAHVQVELVEHETFFIESDFYKGLLKNAPQPFESIKKLIEQLIKQLDVESVKINIVNNIPVAAGMGASAAIAGAIVQGFYQYKNVSLSEEDLISWIQASEQVAHGNPSGIDTFGVLSDQSLIYEKNKAITPLTFHMDGYLLIVFSNTHGSTKEAVSLVSQYVQSDTKVLEDMEVSVNQAIKHIHDKNIKALGIELNTYHQYLIDLGVSTKTLDTMVKDALSFGSLGAKLSGGGLGGCMIALFSQLPLLNQLQEHFKKQGYHHQFIIDLKGI